jgi:CheY-like chemotaxis protein
MLRIFLAAAILFLMPLSASGLQVVQLDKTMELVDLSRGESTFYKSSQAHRAFSSAPTNPARFVTDLEHVVRVDQRNGGSYWFYTSVTSVDKDLHWVLNPSNSIIDHIRIFIYSKSGVREIVTGHLHSREFGLGYGVSLDIPEGETVELLINFDSRYFSSQPKIEIEQLGHYRMRLGQSVGLVMLCFGVVAGLAVFNLLNGYFGRNRSYIYLSAYAGTVFISWGGLTLFSQWLKDYSYTALIAPFFLSIAANTLFLIHFLELRKTHPRLSNLSYALVISAVFLAASAPFFPPSQYRIAYDITFLCWWLMATFTSVYCMIHGYKAARFFIAGYIAVLISGFISLPTILTVESVYNQNLVVFLVAQVLYLLVLSMAMADRLSITQKEKNKTLEQLYATKVTAEESARVANGKLKKALVKAEKEAQIKIKFIRTVSHELRTPLNSIMASVDQWHETNEKDHQRDLMGFIHHGTARLQTQVDNLVLLAETDDDALVVNDVDFEVRPLLEKVCLGLAGLVHEDVVFSYKPATGAGANQLPRTLKGDAYLIEHFLRVVLENACSYTERGGIQFCVEWDRDESSLKVDVIDTGSGMSRTQQKNMFDSLVNVSRGEARASSGLGLGITICHRLSDLLMADFTMESEAGEGTTVHINLPMKPGTQGLAVIRNEVKHLGLVLIVEDNTINAKVLEQLVTNLGYKVDVVHSGQEALERLIAQPYSLVLMDLQMPVMDGLTAAIWIRRRGVNTPIIAVSVNSDAKVRRRCIEVGMNDFIVKPVRRADIQRVLERQISQAESS